MSVQELKKKNPVKAAKNNKKKRKERREKKLQVDNNSNLRSAHASCRKQNGKNQQAKKNKNCKELQGTRKEKNTECAESKTQSA